MTNEYRVIGPPGTGKTTYLGRQIERFVEERGTSNVLVASLTRAAPAEVAGRKLSIPRDNIGTLHAHAYRALDRPKIADSPDHLPEWNKWVASRGAASLILTDGVADIEDAPTDGFARAASRGDACYAEYNVLRARMVPRERWLKPELKIFARYWESWKEATGYLDFTDLIEVATRRCAEAPGRPDAIFADEAQDMDALEMALLRKWGAAAETLVCVGDADQNLYEWRGSDPGAFMADLPPGHERVLAQSYRVPRAVHKVALTWINRARGRKPVEYLPRDYPGEVRWMACHLGYPDPLLDSIAGYLAKGKTVMILTSCGYLLDPVKLVLRHEGLPFHNPYRKKRGDWNPLNAGYGVSSTERVAAFLKPDPTVWGAEANNWSGQDLALWAELVESKGVFKRGAKTVIKDLEGEHPIPLEYLDAWFEEGVARQAIEEGVEWLAKHLLTAKERAASFGMTIARKRPDELTREPRIVIGTIHSVKGAEADVVYLFPDLSQAGAKQWDDPIGEAAIRRQFYVGFTRARETLVLCSQSQPDAVSFAEVI